MKPIFLAFFSILLFASCSSDSNNSSVSFFNLNQGNLWVYKRYSSNDNVSYAFTNRIDSVRVIGDTLISGIHFAKLQHKIFNSGVFSNKTFETLRVDSAGHLVDQNSLVYHPGIDLEYQNIRDVGFNSNIDGTYTSVGAITSQTQNPFNTDVEGVNYFVYSYYGNFVSTNPSTPNNYIYFQCQQGIGLVCQHCASVSGDSCFEDRLVYYELN